MTSRTASIHSSRKCPHNHVAQDSITSLVASVSSDIPVYQRYIPGVDWMHWFFSPVILLFPRSSVPAHVPRRRPPCNLTVFRPTDIGQATHPPNIPGRNAIHSVRRRLVPYAGLSRRGFPLRPLRLPMPRSPALFTVGTSDSAPPMLS